MNENLINIEENIPIFSVILNRPEKRNALSMQLLDQLSEILADIRDDKSIRVVVLKGKGNAFCAGADVSIFKEMKSYDAFNFSKKIQGVFNEIEELPKPVIAVIDGFALGGGLELAMACDLRIASRNAKLGSPEINLGIFPGGGGTQRLVKIVGFGRAKELLMLGKVLSAEEAAEIGLVNKVVTSEELDSTVNKIAKKLSKKPPIALALLKHIVKYGGSLPTIVGEELEALGFDAIFATNDAKRGIKAFLNKEKPEFKGE